MGKRGFTFFELLIALLIFLVAVGGLVAAQEGCLTLAEGARNLTVAMNAVRQKTEEIRNAAFPNVAAYNGQTFTMAGWGVQHMGVVRVDTTDPALVQIFVSVSWRQKGGRVFGEDTDLDGVPDAGEDANGNGRLDSPAGFATLRADL